MSTTYIHKICGHSVHLPKISFFGFIARIATRRGKFLPNIKVRGGPPSGGSDSRGTCPERLIGLSPNDYFPLSSAFRCGENHCYSINSGGDYPFASYLKWLNLTWKYVLPRRAIYFLLFSSNLYGRAQEDGYVSGILSSYVSPYFISDRILPLLRQRRRRCVSISPPRSDYYKEDRPVGIPLAPYGASSVGKGETITSAAPASAE